MSLEQDRLLLLLLLHTCLAVCWSAEIEVVVCCDIAVLRGIAAVPCGEWHGLLKAMLESRCLAHAWHMVIRGE